MYPLPWVPIPCKWIITIMCEQVWYHLQFALSMLPFSVWNLQFATGCSLSEGGALWVWRMEPGSIHWDNNVWHICVYCTLYDIFVKGPLRPVCTMHCTLYLVQWISCIVQYALQCTVWRMKAGSVHWDHPRNPAGQTRLLLRTFSQPRPTEIHCCVHIWYIQIPKY